MILTLTNKIGMESKDLTKHVVVSHHDCPQWMVEYSTQSHFRGSISLPFLSHTIIPICMHMLVLWKPSSMAGFVEWN